jgi:hypothetical protein
MSAGKLVAWAYTLTEMQERFYLTHPNRELPNFSSDAENARAHETLSEKSELSDGVLELCVEAQVCHSTHVEEDSLANTYKTKEYVLANSAPCHDAGTLHI